MTDPETGTEPARPRLLFFRWTRPGQPRFLLNHVDEQLACLRLFFDVELIDRDSDYDEECDRFQPDLALFESGVYVGPRQVRNVHTHPDVPKVGFLNGDAFDPVRAVFVSDMAEWGVETFFTVSASMADYTPEIADRLFCWPNFVDPAVHRDHGLPNVVPIVLTGSQARHYPWRNRVSRVLAQHYPVLTMPHFGWAESTGARRMSVGESYSRLIASAAFAPSCGSFTRDLVRKHLEIPAARTCLIAERTPVLEAAGYADMVNCVFADADDVIDKVDHLLAYPDELTAITDAGHRLVQDRHTAAHRRQIRDWYDLVSATGSADGIVQEHPLAPLTRPADRDGSAARVGDSGGAGEAVDRVLVRRGWAALGHGRRDAAVRSFTGASNYQYMPEAEVGKAVARLLDGDAAGADATIATLLDHNDRLYAPVDPDPVQWAVHLWALVCRGALEDAAAAAARHPGLRHPTLDRVLAVVQQVTGVPTTRTASPVRASVSPLPPSSWAQWLDTVRTTLVRNGRGELAGTVARLAAGPDPADRADRAGRPGPGHGTARPVAIVPPSPHPRRPRPRVVVRRALGALRADLRERVREAGRRWVTAAWLGALDDAVEREDLDRLIVIGRSRLDLHERSLRLAAARNPRVPEVVPVAALDPTPAPDLATLVYLGPRADLAAADAADVARSLAPARVVVVVGMLRPGAVRLVDELVGTGDFEIVDSATRRGGYIVLRHRLGRPAAGRPAVG